MAGCIHLRTMFSHDDVLKVHRWPRSLPSTMHQHAPAACLLPCWGTVTPDLGQGRECDQDSFSRLSLWGGARLGLQPDPRKPGVFTGGCLCIGGAHMSLSEFMRMFSTTKARVPVHRTDYNLSEWEGQCTDGTQAQPLSINTPWASELLGPTASRVYTAPSKHKTQGEKISQVIMSPRRNHKHGDIFGCDLEKLPIEK